MSCMICKWILAAYEWVLRESKKDDGVTYQEYANVKKHVDNFRAYCQKKGHVK